MSTTITVNPVVIHLESTLNSVDIVNNQPAIQINNSYPDNPIVDSIQFDTTPELLPTGVGTLFYDEHDKTLSVILENSTLQIGQELYIICLNKTGSTITNGSVVYVNGAQGNRPTIGLASTTDYNIANLTIGVVTHGIDNNETGMITISGLVRELNTSDYTEGDRIYLSSVAGQFTKVRPSFGTARIAIGIVVKSHVTDGWIGIRINNIPYMFGDPTNGNFSGFEDDGTLLMNGAARTHEDLNFDVINSGGPSANVPDYVVINNVVYREFTSANNQACGASKEIPHSAYLGGQTLIPHTHIFLKSGESAGTTGVTFTLYWELRQGSSTTNGSVTVSATSAQLAATPHKIDLYASTGFACSTSLGGQLSMRIARTGGNAGDVIAITYGVHHENDTPGGSRSSNSK